MSTILYIHQYFKTPQEGGALRSYFIAKGMVDNGYQVQMITAHNHTNYELKTIEGIQVHYLPVNYSNSLSFGRRYFAFIKFVYLAIKLISKLPKFDLAYASSTPLTVGFIALWIKRKKKVPYIFEVRDLWPEAPIQLGIMKNKLLKALSRKLEERIYAHADKIVALSPGIQNGIKEVLPSARVTLVSNMSDLEFFDDSKYSINPDKSFVIGYFGALGFANDVDFIINIAHACQHQNSDIKFILVGEGAQMEFLEENIQKLKLENTELFPLQNRFDIRELMKKVDACLITFLDFPILETNSPNKFFDGLAAGKLCIVNTKGWLKDLVEENQCGFYADPENIKQFPDQIKPFMEDSSLLEEYQNNARSLAKREFSRSALTAKICDEVAKALPNI